MSSVEHRHVGFFPTVQLSRILSMPYIEKNEKYLWRLRCWRERLRHKEVKNPLPYLRVADIVERNAVIDYSWMRHNYIKLNDLRNALTDNDIDEMVVEEITIVIPKEDVWPKHEIPMKSTTSIWEKDVLVAATFKRRATKGVKDEKYLEAIREASEEFLKIGGKLSSLDLVSLQDSKVWAKGGDQRYDLEPPLLWWVLYEIDPDLAKVRAYRRVRGEVWELAEVKGVRELVKA